MALATNPIDINRGTTGLTLTPEQSKEVWAATIQESAVMQLAQQVTLPGSGIAIPVVTGDPVADFVAESAEKPVSESTFGTKMMTPYKIAVIEIFSNEFRRDFRALYDELVRRLPYAIGAKFDATVFGGTAPGSGFDVLTGATAVAIGGTAPAESYLKIDAIIDDMIYEDPGADEYEYVLLSEEEGYVSYVSRPAFAYEFEQMS